MGSGMFSAARELPRLREISSVLIRHGLGDLVRRAGVSTLLERAGQVLQWGQAGEVAHLEPQQRAKLAHQACDPGTRLHADVLGVGGELHHFAAQVAAHCLRDAARCSRIIQF